jgi:hypothetical protein|nr:MAG TPA: hypothetical protein [Caudoviricetes sp.]
MVKNVLTPQYIQENIEVIKALNVLANKLS